MQRPLSAFIKEKKAENEKFCNNLGGTTREPVTSFTRTSIGAFVTQRRARNSNIGNFNSYNPLNNSQSKQLYSFGKAERKQNLALTS